MLFRTYHGRDGMVVVCSFSLLLWRGKLVFCTVVYGKLSLKGLKYVLVFMLLYIHQASTIAISHVIYLYGNANAYEKGEEEYTSISS